MGASQREDAVRRGSLGEKKLQNKKDADVSRGGL